MAPRAAKEKEEQAVAPPRTVSIEEFITTRDRVVNGLSSLQFAIASLLNAYLDHCKGLVGDGYPTAGTLNVNTFADAASGAVAAAAAVAADVEAGLTDKKGRKKKVKKEKDPNAPKRPLTAAFLFSQAARPIVKQDLEHSLADGEKLGPNQVNEECNRRWNALPESEKDAWKDKYKENLQLYREEMKKYEDSLKAAGEEIEVDAEAEDEDAAGGVAHVDSDAEGSDEDREPTPPPKAPSPPPSKGSKRRKTTKENGVAVPAATEVPLPAASSRASAVPIPGSATPATEKKKSTRKVKNESPVTTKRSAKKGKATEEEIEAEPAPEAEKKPERKRKRKGDA